MTRDEKISDNRTNLPMRVELAAYTHVRFTFNYQN
jgi:hypothetical protein